MQTLLQLLPPSIFSKPPLRTQRWDMPCLRIQDKPRLKWRGFMLDVSRHFFTPAEIKQLFDAMALHKLNIFHWHLTDDQGWRIEIKKYPRLTGVGAWRKGVGFTWTPNQLLPTRPMDVMVVITRRRRCAILFLTPGPGTSRSCRKLMCPVIRDAALAAYPEFSCSGGPYSTDMSEAVAAGILCPGKEETFEFVENILAEVMGLFQGQFIHIGGDEVSKQNWRTCPKCHARMVQEGLSDVSELQRYFTRRIEKFVERHGKRVVGWSEIRADDLSKSSVIMDWTGGGPEAARSAHDVVMAPEEYCYLDLYQSRNRDTEPPAAGAYLPLRKVYGFEPVPAGLTLEQQRHVLGAQANLWTEYISSFAQVEYMTFPRLCAFSEVVWSPKETRSWEDFKRRLINHEQRLNQLGVNYRRDK